MFVVLHGAPCSKMSGPMPSFLSVGRINTAKGLPEKLSVRAPELL